jgi:DNA-binding CsgD family transcriptional regulator/PAS domain-containing protein
MPRLRGVDEARRDALASDIHQWPIERGAALARLLPHLAELVGGARAVALELVAGPEGVTAGGLQVAQLDAVTCRRALDAALSGGAAPLLSLYPVAEERNHPVALHLEEGALAPGAAALAAALGVTGACALRLSLVDDTEPLAWLAFFREGPFDARERQIVSSLAVPLRARLLLEREVAEAPLASAALHAALEAIGTPAFVLDATGRVERLNVPGRALLARDPRARAELRACALFQGNGRFTTTPLLVPGNGAHLLAVAPAPDGGLAARLASASGRWRLTPRQADVLARVSQGFSNKAIAAELACADGTVEIHVSALLGKAGCVSRAELVARFWSQTPGPSGSPVAPPR